MQQAYEVKLIVLVDEMRNASISKVTSWLEQQFHGKGEAVVIIKKAKIQKVKKKKQ